MATATTPSLRIEFPTLTPKQSEIWNYICDAEPGEVTIVGWGGSVGGGKTGGLIRIAIYLAAQYPGINILITRNTLANLKNPGGTIRQFEEALPGGGALVKDGGIVLRGVTDNNPRCQIRLPTFPPNVKSTVYFRGADDDSFYKSTEIGAVLVEEADGISEDSWVKAQSRLRQTLPDGTIPKYLALAVTNPSVSWWNEWFIDNIDEHAEQLKGVGRIKFYQSKMSDNTFLPPKYEERLRATFDEEEIEANVEGSFSSFRGRVYGNFSPETHAVHQEDWRRGAELVQGMSSWRPQSTKTIIIHGQRLIIPKFKYAVGGLDFGGAQKNAHLSTGVVSVVAESGRDFVIDTFADNGPGVHNRQVEWMREMERVLGMQINWAADGTQAAFITTMSHVHGFHIQKNTGGNDSWRKSVEYIRERFMLLEDGYPKTMIMDTQNNRLLMKQIQQYRVEMKPGPNGVMRDTPIRVHDDAYDGFRYLEELLEKLQRQIHPRKVLPPAQGKSRPSRVPLAEYDRFIIENRERLNRERAAEMAAKARQKFSIPA
jgi:hypothetical protein